MTSSLVTGKPTGLQLLDRLNPQQKELYLKLPHDLGLEPMEWKGNLYLKDDQINLLNSLLILIDDEALKEFHQALEDSSGSFLYKCSRCGFLAHVQRPLRGEALQHECDPLVLKRQLPESHLLSANELLKMRGHFRLIASGDANRLNGLLHSYTLR